MSESEEDGGRRQVAAIDIGTNSVLLLIAEATASGLSPIIDLATVTRLGEGVDRTRRLDEAAIERTLACLAAYAKEIQARGVTTIRVVGTSAMRDAQGGDVFRRRAAELLGVTPETISGDEEATLTYGGGLSGLVTSGEILLFDIGGGSTEFIVGQAGAISSKCSLDIGSVRLTERHVKSDPPSVDELAALDADIEATLIGAPLGGGALVGVAGTVTTLAAIALEIDPYVGSLVHGSSLAYETLDRVTEALSRATLERRLQMPGLSPKRADVIVAGARLCRAIARRCGESAILVSDRGVRWGVAEQLATSNGPPPK